jgi:hypothetical protein
MAGLVPAIHEGRASRSERSSQAGLAPRINRTFQATRPVLQVPLALNGSADVVMVPDIDQPSEAVASGEPVGHPLAVFPDAADKIAGHTDIQAAVWPVRHDVNPTGLHVMFISSAGAGLQPPRGWPGQAWLGPAIHEGQRHTTAGKLCSALRTAGPVRHGRTAMTMRFDPPVRRCAAPLQKCQSERTSSR